MRTRPKRTRGKRCCVTDAHGKTIACFARARDAAALQRIVKRSRTTSSCALPGVRGRSPRG